MTYYPYTINVPGWRFRLEALHACSTSELLLPKDSIVGEPTSLEIALAVRIKDLELALRAVIDRAENDFSSPRLRGLPILDLDSDVALIAKAALETKC